jgi:hypothetical protein
LVTSVLPSISLAWPWHFIDREGQPHAALGVGAQFLELALAASAGMDLALDHIERARQLSAAASASSAEMIATPSATGAPKPFKSALA